MAGVKLEMKEREGGKTGEEGEKKGKMEGGKEHEKEVWKEGGPEQKK